ncbi:MAG: TAT-variant-translocated molybdopterin oxidoreductase [bacterium]
MPSINDPIVTLPLTEEPQGRRYWRSLDELADQPEFREFVEREFPNRAAGYLEGPDRRQFLRIMAASFGLAGLTACRWPKENIVPYSQRPEGRMPGVPERYATSMELGGIGHGLLVTSYDGRPIKVEGNPSHPCNLGAADVLAQASVLEMYDPDRGKYPFIKEENQSRTVSWPDVDSFLRQHFSSARQQGGKGFCVLSEATSSPSVRELRGRLLQAFPNARWFEYESVSGDNERLGTRLAFGEALRVHPHLDQAKIILCLDADPLGAHPAKLKHVRDFNRGRDPESGGMSRLYAVESHCSTTGSLADHRLALPPSTIQPFALALAAELVQHPDMQLPASMQGIQEFLKNIRAEAPHKEWRTALVKDLVANRGQCLVAVGCQQPPFLHALAALLNDMLGNTGRTATYTRDEVFQGVSHGEAIRGLAETVKAGQVETLLILGGNPAYDAPADLEFSALLAKIPTSLHLSLYRNETSALCGWYIPRAHYLEAWGDTRAYDGTISTVQPLIEPLYGGRTPAELLARILGDEITQGYEITRRILKNLLQPADFEADWRQWLHDGVIADTACPPVTPTIQPSEIAAAWKPSASEGPYEIVFIPDTKLYDGRFANNGWLQELPDFMTKMSWDNAALLSPATAGELQVQDGDLLRLKLRGREAEAAVFILPGQPAKTVTVALGYGRTQAGRVGNQAGFPVHALRVSDALNFSGGLTIEKTGRTYLQACTQDHHAIDVVGMRERGERIHELIREATLENYQADPHIFHQEEHAPAQLFAEHPYEGHKWGMVIDLNACTGCSACVVACQAENNIPVVGKEQIQRGREMQWIRIDRYFSGEPEAPRVARQPVACVHCENAPCEQVCPVNATVHTHEGLNVMVYNRCVGTRYCSNNCPFKVRRFNFFNYHKHLEETEKMVFNPEVTVRSRGVMEKCTYCVQRIEQVKIQAQNNGRTIQDGEIVPACAQTCPAQAIVFGDLNDPASRVSKLHEHNRAYAMLGELNVKPRTAYLARVWNPNPELDEKRG